MTVDAYHEIRRRALERIDGSGLDPQRDTARLVELLRATVDDYQRHAHLGETRSLADPDATVRFFNATSGGLSEISFRA